MNAMNLMLALNERGLELVLDPTAGRVNVFPASKLTDEDRANIRHHLAAIKRLLSTDYTHLGDGWQCDADMLERAYLVRVGKLIDSCIFRTEAGARAFLTLLDTYPPPQAFRAACGIEDATAVT